MRAYIALFLAQIMLITLLSPFVSADDVETSGDVSWNGTIVLDGNYTVSSGDTLTISPGTMIDAKEFYIYVNGTLIGDNATIFSSTPSKIGDVSNAYSPGVWDGLFIGNSGHAILDNMTISNASSCLSVYGDLGCQKPGVIQLFARIGPSWRCFRFYVHRQSYRRFWYPKYWKLVNQ